MIATMHYSQPETNTSQCTLNEPVHCTGIGLHDGHEVSLTLLPAPPDSGTHFLRRDVDITRALIPASWHSIVETHPDTLLANKYGIGVHGVEPLLAALHGCGVDNVLIEVSGYEVPIFDGSSTPLLQMINQAGVIAQAAARQIIWMDRLVAVRIGEHYACIMPGLSPSITVDDVIPGGSHAPQNLTFSLLDHVFEREIAPARHPQHETPYDDRYTDSPPLVDVKMVDAKMVDAKTPRFADEFMRYQMLESIGLLALAEMPIYGQIYFYKPNAFLIDALMQKLFEDRDSWRQLSYAEVEQMTGKLSTGSHQQTSDRRVPPADAPKFPFRSDPALQ
jgi:UDP-3-O-[3-hydroxymyristoyl] N-acetylglucosamine deacetylase